MPLEVVDLLHDLAEHFRAVLRRIAVFDETNLDVEFELVPDDLVVEPVREGGLRIDDFLYLFRH